MFKVEMLTFFVLLVTKTVICDPGKTRVSAWPVSSSTDPITGGNRLFLMRNSIKEESRDPVSRSRRFIDGVSQDSLESYQEESNNQESSEPAKENRRYDCHSQAQVDDQNHEIGLCREVPCIVYLQPGKIFKQLLLTFAFDSLRPSYKRVSVSAQELCINDPSRGYKIEINLREEIYVLRVDKWVITVTTNCANGKVETPTNLTHRLYWLRNVLVEAEGSSSWRKTFTHPDCLKLSIETEASTTQASTPSLNFPHENTDVFKVTFWPAFACSIGVLLCIIAVVIVLKECKTTRSNQISDQEQLISTSNRPRILQDDATSNYDTENSLYGQVIYHHHHAKQPHAE